MDQMPETMSTLPITLVIPAYNRGHLIAETVRSALSQRPRFQEIIVVNDGSTDDTANVLSQFHGEITVIPTSNQGVQAARNTGIEAASTPWLALLDSDDLLLPEYMSCMGRWITEHPHVDALYCNFVTFGSHSQDARDKLAQSPFDFLAGCTMDSGMATQIPDLYARSIAYQPLFQCGVIVKKSFIATHGGYDERLKGIGSEDWEFTLRLISKGQVAVCPKVLARVRKHDTNDSKSVIHVKLGEIKVLQHAMHHHKVATDLQRVMSESMHQRRLDAFNAAFDAQEFDQALHIAQDIHRPSSLKHHVKRAICASPRPVRHGLWRAVQRKHGT